MNIMLIVNNQYGDSGPQAGDIGEAYGFDIMDEGEVFFFCHFPNYPDGYYVCLPHHIQWDKSRIPDNIKTFLHG